MKADWYFTSALCQAQTKSLHVCYGGSVVLVMVLHLPLAGCVNSEKLLHLCELQCPHSYLRRLCGKETRIHVPMAHSKCSENVGIFSCCHYYKYHLIFKLASWPVLQLWTLRFRGIKSVLRGYNLRLVIPAPTHARLHTPYPSRPHCLYQLALKKWIIEMRSSKNGLVHKYLWTKGWCGD